MAREKQFSLLQVYTCSMSESNYCKTVCMHTHIETRAWRFSLKLRRTKVSRHKSVYMTRWCERVRE